MYDPLVKRWILTGQMLTARSAVGVAVVKRRLYVIGGTNGTHRLSTCEVFDSRTSEWSLVCILQMLIFTTFFIIYKCGVFFKCLLILFFYSDIRHVRKSFSNVRGGDF